MERSPNCLAKLERMRKTLRHEEADRVPVSDFFWGGFLKRWREETGVAADTDIYRYYDLDWKATLPNMDPHIRPFEVLREDETEVVVKTGFGATIRKRLDLAMPAFMEFETNTIEKLRAFRFDAPDDERRFFSGGDNQIAGVGDGFERNSPPWIETVRKEWPEFPVFGSACEAHEMLWRITGSERALRWMGEYPDDIERFADRLHEYNLGLIAAQIRAADGLLDGMVIWGDVAYRKGMLFSPAFWRKVFKPGVKAMVDLCHSHGLPVIYHGCGNVSRIFGDFIEVGVDAYNPLEAKAGLDVVELRRQYGHRIGFCGNMDVLAWAEAEFDSIERIVMRKLNAAKGGGYIFQSDHSVPSNVSAERYEFVLKLVRRHGRYPLSLGVHDLPDVH
jgi:hypothetical protein